MSKDHLDKIKNVLKADQNVTARVIKIDKGERRIGLSIFAFYAIKLLSAQKKFSWTSLRSFQPRRASPTCGERLTSIVSKLAPIWTPDKAIEAYQHVIKAPHRILEIPRMDAEICRVRTVAKLDSWNELFEQLAHCVAAAGIYVEQRFGIKPPAGVLRIKGAPQSVDNPR